MIYKVKAAQEELISINEPTGDVAYYVDAEMVMMITMEHLQRQHGRH